jgi:hypothetical protein
LRFQLQWEKLAVLTALCTPIVVGQTPSAAPPDADNPRIFGVLPNYTTVSDATSSVEPLTFKQKAELFARQTYDPGTIAAAAAGAGLSQAQDDDPKYGEGWGPYGERFGAATADLTTQNFFGGVLLAGLFHEDPRYFRRGPAFGFWNRLGYSISRVAITRTDHGTNRFNFSGTIGMSMGIALSNAYYPDASVNGAEVASRFASSLAASAIYNILPEFWPDIRAKLFHRNGKPTPQPETPGAKQTDHAIR